jgi:hypothetical protein
VKEKKVFVYQLPTSKIVHWNKIKRDQINTPTVECMWHFFKKIGWLSLSLFN